ncbi:MAG TPA: hypothetical protein PKH77_17780 [Anaerolineae bacterium]|nr:hypothetical protein [Anaerolineae bacterium]
MGSNITKVLSILLCLVSPLPIRVVEDYQSPVAAAGVQATIPTPCTVQYMYVVRWAWRWSEGEAADEATVVARLSVVSAQVNYLFYAAGTAERYQLPAWAMGDDCRLAVRFLSPGEEVGVTEREKTLLVENRTDLCGLAYLWDDDRAGRDNYNTQGSVATIARGCLTTRNVAHELLHALGAAQASATHASDSWHVSDYGDVLAVYSEQTDCVNPSTIDCNGDDYYSLAQGERLHPYLRSHFNLATDSPYLLLYEQRTIYVPIFFK